MPVNRLAGTLGSVGALSLGRMPIGCDLVAVESFSGLASGGRGVWSWACWGFIDLGKGLISRMLLGGFEKPTNQPTNQPTNLTVKPPAGATNKKRKTCSVSQSRLKEDKWGPHVSHNHNVIHTET